MPLHQPLGTLLGQILEPDSRMALAYERSVGYLKETHTHDRLMLVCPRGATRLEVKDPVRTHAFDSRSVLVVPANVPHATSGLTAIYDTLALYPDAQFVDELIRENGLGESDRQSLQAGCQLVKRSRWLDDILDRYFFERVLNHRSPIGCTFFLEKQILNELARLLFKDRFPAYGQTIDEASVDAAAKALHFIEANLFEPLTVARIARAARVSESSLLRAFKEQYRQTPYSYLRDRRLDEAAHLLAKGELTVGDVALLVGYDDFAAFSKAFKQRFRCAPNRYRQS